MNKAIIGYAGAIALAAGAAVIGQNQPSSSPATRPPTASQPSTTPGQPGRTTTDQQTRWRESAERIQSMNQRMEERNQRLLQQLSQAQTQTGEARVNALAEVLTAVVQEHEYMNRSIIQLQRMVFRNYLDTSNLSGEWDTWREQYPFLDESEDQDDGMNGDGRDQTTPSGTTPPRSPR
jgi:TolA-binding protein